MTVDTAAFVRSHGRDPKGRGGWGFFFDGATDPADVWWAPAGTFTQARKAAVAQARKRGATSVAVAP